MSNKLKEAQVETRDERVFFKAPDQARELTSPEVQPHDKPTEAWPERKRRGLSRFKTYVKPSTTVNFFERQLAVEVAKDTPFLLIPVIIIAGSATYFNLPAEPAAHNIPIAIGAIAALRVLVRNNSHYLKYLVNALLIFVLAMGLGQLRTKALATQMLGSEISTRITGRIISIEQRPDQSVRYTIDVIKTERPKLRYAPERVRATARKPLADAQIGGGINGFIRLRPPSGPARPGGFDFAFYNYFDGIGANGFFLGAPKVIEIEKASGLLKVSLAIERARFWLAKRIRSNELSDASSVSAALITGEKAAISEEVNEVLRRSGLAHILSISGLHMALVAGTIMFAIRLILAMTPDASATRPTKKIAAIAGFAAISIYLFLAGASVATQRSFIMLAVMLGALMADRAALTMRNLAISAIVVCLIAPEAVLGPSFQMSFSATLALIAAYGAWQARNFTKEHDLSLTTSQLALRKSGAFIGGLSMTSIIAGTATGIYAAYHFQRIAVLGLLGNLLAMPIVSLITMPAAILGTLLIPVGLDGYVFAVMNWSVAAVTKIAQTVSDISPDGNTGAMSQSALLLLTSAMFCLCLLRSKLRFIALPLLLLVVFNGTGSQIPSFVISEDARQVAAIGTNGKISVNRSRPNAFILEQWQAAYVTYDVQKPAKENIEKDRFYCKNKDICQYSESTHDKHAALFWIADPQVAKQNADLVCRDNQIIILAYAPAYDICAQRKANTLTITAQQLALNGSVEIYKKQAPNGTGFYTKYAINPVGNNQAIRPWNDHRQYSRSARNLAPYERKKSVVADQPD